MKIIKKINNNVAIGQDSRGCEVIVFGKGIGFPQMPYDLKDLHKIERTFYDIDQKYYSLLNEIPEDIFRLTAKMVDVARTKIGGSLNPNLVFTLSDHISFAVTRNRKGMNIALPYSYELEYEYPEITKIAGWMVKNVNQRFHTTLHKGEVTSITMHLLNAFEGEADNPNEKEGGSSTARTTHIIAAVVNIIEEYFSMTIDKSSFNFFRFQNHMKYFIQRKEHHEEFYDGNYELYEEVKRVYPQVGECVRQIDDYIQKEFPEPCSKDELLYLIIHVNRLYMKEDCNQSGITSEQR